MYVCMYAYACAPGGDKDPLSSSGLQDVFMSAYVVCAYVSAHVCIYIRSVPSGLQYVFSSHFMRAHIQTCITKMHTKT